MDTIISEFEGWTIRIRPGSGTRILVLLHGWTGDENSMSIFIRNIQPDYWIILPRAPHKAISSGYSWRELSSSGGWPTIEAFQPSAMKIINMIEHFSEANHLQSSTIDMAGFSQGGAMTFTVSTYFPDRIRKAGILAGFAPVGADGLLTSETFAKKHFFIAHGTRDATVPIEMAKRTKLLLENSGAIVTYCESEIGHKLSSDGLRSFVEYLAN